MIRLRFDDYDECDNVFVLCGRSDDFGCFELSIEADDLDDFSGEAIDRYITGKVHERLGHLGEEIVIESLENPYITEEYK